MSKAWWKSSQPAGTRPTRTHPVPKADPDGFDLTRLLNHRPRINVGRQRSFDDDDPSLSEISLSERYEWDSESDESTYSPVGDTPGSPVWLSFEPHPPLVGGELRPQERMMELPQRGGSWPVLLWMLTAAACIKTGRLEIARRTIGKQARKFQWTWSIAGYLVAKMMLEEYPSHLISMISLAEDKASRCSIRRRASRGPIGILYSNGN